MLYSFTTAGSYAQVRADVAAVSRALPPGAVTGTGSWLTAEQQAEGNGAIMEPFVVAFALIGLAMAVLIVGNVVSGAVVAGYRRIGVLKSVGLTPAQVVVAYLSRVGWPALAGCLAGVVAGNLLAAPVLHSSAGVYGVGSQQVPWWAAPAAPGRTRAGGAVRQARAHHRDPCGGRVRRHRRDLRVRAAVLAEPGGGKPVPFRHGAGADPAVPARERPGAGTHHGAGRRGDSGAARPAWHAPRRG
jgi:hypothetical protein